MAALAIGDEHPPVRRLQILEPQPDHLAATQPAEHHRFEHRPVTPPANRPQQRDHVGRVEHLRQRPRRADQRRPRRLPARTGATCRHPTRHRVRRPITAQHEIVEQPRHHRQPAPDRRAPPAPTSPSARRTTRPSPAPRRCAVMNSNTSAGVTVDRVLVDHREEHPQIRHRRRSPCSADTSPPRTRHSGPAPHPAQTDLTQPPTTTSRSPISHKQTLDEKPPPASIDHRNIYSSGRAVRRPVLA